MTDLREGDFVEDAARNPSVKGRVIRRDLDRPDAFIVKLTDGSVQSIGASYLRKLSKRRDDDEGGLRPGAAAWLGFDLVCQCGHDEGHHEQNDGKCTVHDCRCKWFVGEVRP